MTKNSLANKKKEVKARGKEDRLKHDLMQVVNCTNKKMGDRLLIVKEQKKAKIPQTILSNHNYKQNPFSDHC